MTERTKRIKERQKLLNNDFMTFDLLLLDYMLVKHEDPEVIKEDLKIMTEGLKEEVE